MARLPNRIGYQSTPQITLDEVKALRPGAIVECVVNDDRGCDLGAHYTVHRIYRYPDEQDLEGNILIDIDPDECEDWEGYWPDFFKVVSHAAPDFHGALAALLGITP